MSFYRHIFLYVLIFSSITLAQDSLQTSPTAEERIKDLDQQIRILKRQREVEQEVSIAKAASSTDLPIKWSGEIRLRSESDGRDFNLKTPYNLYTVSRVRFGASLALSQNVSTVIQLQDSRLFGEESAGPLYSSARSFNTQGNIKSFNNAPVDIHQAYIKVDKFLTDALSFKFGRTELSYGSERIISVSNWNNNGRVFDGLIVRYAHSSGFLDAFILNTGEVTPALSVTPANTKYVRDSAQLALGGYYSNTISDDFSIDAHLIYQSDAQLVKRDTIALQRTTAGVLLKGRSSALFGDAEISYQLGQKNGLSIGAYYLALSAGYDLDQDWLTTVSAHLDILSGRKEGESDVAKSDVKSYELVFPSNHRYFGFADFFKSGGTGTPQYDRGIVDLYLRLLSKPWDNLTVTLVLHNFSLQNKLTLGATASAPSSSALGQELDLVGAWKYSKNLTFEIGITGFVPGAVTRNKFGASDAATWNYLTTQINF